jgi:hypothetical protein
MPVLDVFDADAFSFVSLSKAINQMAYVPDYLGSIPGLIEEVPIRTEEVWIERRGYQAALIQTTARGTPPSQVGSDRRDARAFRTKRIADASRVYAYELLNIRRFGSEIDIKDVAEEVSRRMFKMTSNMDLTEEYHRLNLVTQGKMFDGAQTVFTGSISGTTLTVTVAPAGVSLGVGSAFTGSGVADSTFITALGTGAGGVGTYTVNNSQTVSSGVLTVPGNLVYDWTAEFATYASGAGTPQTPISPVDFTFNAAANSRSGLIRKAANEVIRFIYRALRMGNIPTGRVQIVGLCGDQFYDALTTDDEVHSTYVNWTAAADLRDSVGKVWSPFQYAGINWVNYRGTDDNATLAVPPTGVRFFPTNAGIFQVARAPGEKMEMIGSYGQKRYAQIVRDVQRDFWADVETYSYPLYVCTLPQALVDGVS